jgi:hypothetical protein
LAKICLYNYFILQVRKNEHSKYDLKGKLAAFKLIKSFPDQSFVEEPKGKVFCQACCHSVSTKKSTASDHILADRHIVKLRNFNHGINLTNRITSFIGEKDEVSRHCGDTLSMEIRSSRLKIARCLLIGGISFKNCNAAMPLSSVVGTK